MIDELRRDGVAVLPQGLTPQQANDIEDWFSTCTVTNAHVWAKGTQFAAMSATRELGWPMWTCHMEAAVLAPHLFEAILQTRGIAWDYFGEEPLLYSMNAFWTQRSPQVYDDTHSWHRDCDDRKQLVVFVYGSDVDVPEDGAHLYQVGTANVGDNDLGYHFTAPPPEKVRTIRGPAGTVFLSDTRGLHMGVRPQTGNRRCLMWGRWGVTCPPESYGWDKLSPVDRRLLDDRYPADPELQHAIRLVVA